MDGYRVKMDDVLLVVQSDGDQDFYEIPYDVAYFPDAVNIIQKYNNLMFKQNNTHGSKANRRLEQYRQELGEEAGLKKFREENKQTEQDCDQAINQVTELLESWKKLGYMNNSYGAYGKYHTGSVVFICLT